MKNTNTNPELDRICKVVHELTDANEHSEARAQAAAWLVRYYDSQELPASGNLFCPLADALYKVSLLHDWAGNLSSDLFHVRMTLWRLVLDTGANLGEPFASAVKRIEAAM